MKKMMIPAIVAVLAGCMTAEMDALATGNSGGGGGRGLLALSFDDRNFKGWIDALPLFAKYNAHATFFVEGPIDEEAVIALRRLSAAGHSIGLHGLKHANADAEVAAKGSERYFDEEIRPQLDDCRAAGLSITAFAYPNCRGTDVTDAFFASKGFRYVRGGVKGVAPFDPNGDLKGKLLPLHTEDRVFVPRTGLGRTPRVDTVILGESYNTDIEDVKDCIRRASSRDEALFLTSHNIAPDARFIHLRTDWLEQILSTARETGIPVVGFDELPVRRQEKEVK